MNTSDARSVLEEIATANIRMCSAGYLQGYAKRYLAANPRRNGAERISAERVRRVAEKGWTPEHDRTEHADGSLANAAAVLVLEYIDFFDYASEALGSSPHWIVGLHRHASEKYRGQDRYRLLEIAGALVAAELDRLDGGAS